MTVMMDTVGCIDVTRREMNGNVYLTCNVVDMSCYKYVDFVKIQNDMITVVSSDLIVVPPIFSRRLSSLVSDKIPYQPRR